MIRKPNPKGIVSLSRGQQTSVTDIALTRQSWTSSCVSTVKINVPWPIVEPARGVYDFSVLDAALTMAAQNGKQLSFTIGMGYKAPAWVYAAGAQPWTAVSGPDLGTMPLPWDPVYLEIVKEFAQALGDHCDGNPTLAYIQMQGFAQAGELYCADSEPDNTNLMMLGAGTAWLDAAQKITGYYMKGFHVTPCFVALAKPFLYAAGLQMEMDFAVWGRASYPRRFGVMCHSLSCRSNTGYYPNEAVNIYKPSGFQMVCASADVARMGGTLEQAIDNGIAMAGQFVEVYYPDVQNPDNQVMLAAKNSQLLVGR